MPSQHLRQPADQGGEDRAIRPVQERLRVGSAQHGDFVAQHQQLDVLGRRGATQQHQQVQQPDKDKGRADATTRHTIMPASQARQSSRSTARATSGTPLVKSPDQCLIAIMIDSALWRSSDYRAKRGAVEGHLRSDSAESER